MVFFIIWATNSKFAKYLKGKYKKHISHNNCLSISFFLTFFQTPDSLNSVTIFTFNLAVVVEQPKANDDLNPDGHIGTEELEKTDRWDLDTELPTNDETLETIVQNSSKLLSRILVPCNFKLVSFIHVSWYHDIYIMISWYIYIMISWYIYIMISWYIYNDMSKVYNIRLLKEDLKIKSS